MSAQKPLPCLTFAAAFDAPAADTAAERHFSGVAYSGELIPGHWAWGNLVFDLDTMTLPARLPVLLEHDRYQRAGVIDRFAVDHEKGLTVSGYLLDTEPGRAIASDSDAGFPWQCTSNRGR